MSTWLGVLLQLLLVAGIPVARAEAEPPGVCRRVPLSPAPASATGAAWRTDGKELVIIDGEAARLIRYSPAGRRLGFVERLGMAPYSISSPTQLHATPKGFVVRNEFYYWVWLDFDFKPLRVEGPAGAERIAMLDEVLLGDDQIAGFGSVKKTGRPWLAGLLQVRLRPLRAVELVEELSLASAEGSFHKSLFPTVAAAGSVAYILRLASPPFIQRIAPHKRLRSFPGGFDNLPTLPPLSGPAAVPSVEKALSQATMPIALYGAGRFLFLLTRQPTQQGTTWKLHKIDPEKDRLLGSTTLPTTAFELVLAPGPEKWAILEKDPSDGVGNQKVSNLLLVSKAWVEQGGLKNGATATCK